MCECGCDTFKVSCAVDMIYTFNVADDDIMDTEDFPETAIVSSIECEECGLLVEKGSENWNYIVKKLQKFP